MSALNNDQRFVVVLLIAMTSACWLIAGTTAQTFTTDDRSAIQKFVDVLINFLDAEIEVLNGTSTQNPNNATTALPSNSSTTATPPGNATTVSPESTTLAPNATSLATINATTVSTTVSTTASTTTSSTESTTQVSAAPRRMCFKRRCYKFVNDPGYFV